MQRIFAAKKKVKILEILVFKTLIGEAIIKSTHNLCFGRKMYSLVNPSFTTLKWGIWIFITQTYFRDDFRREGESGSESDVSSKYTGARRRQAKTGGQDRFETEWQQAMQR